MTEPRRSVRLSNINQSRPKPPMLIRRRRSTRCLSYNENQNPMDLNNSVQQKENTVASDDDNNKMRKDKLHNKRKSMNRSHSEQTARRPNDKLFEEVAKNNAVDGEANDTFSSPPKIKCNENKINKKSPSLTPSKLLDRLNINDDDDDDDDDSKEKVNLNRLMSMTSPVPFGRVPNKYQKARRALASGETYFFPCRDKQIEELTGFFHKHLEEQTSSSLYVSGQPGTGKTACLLRLLRLKEFSTNSIRKVYINCTGMTSGGAIYKKICSELCLKAPNLHEYDYQAFIENHLQRVKKTFIIVLDEIDELCSMRQSVLYTIFEWTSLSGVHLLLVGIANSLDLTERMLKRLNTRYQMKPKHIHFPAYDKQGIIEIFKSRLAHVEALDIFPETTLQLLAAKVSAVTGDIRRALDIGRRVLELAEQHNKSNGGQTDVPVNIGQVMEVLKNIYGTTQNLEDDLQNAFPLQQKLILCTLMLMLRNNHDKDISVGRLHEVYSRVCVKRNIQSLDQAEFYSLINLVETRGIFRIIYKKETRLSKIRLLWDEDEVNDVLCDQQLIASILNDTDCLRK